jgi:hypothetical protein
MYMTVVLPELQDYIETTAANKNEEGEAPNITSAMMRDKVDEIIKRHTGKEDKQPAVAAIADDQGSWGAYLKPSPKPEKPSGPKPEKTEIMTAGFDVDPRASAQKTRELMLKRQKEKEAEIAEREARLKQEQEENERRRKERVSKKVNALGW